MDEFCPLCMKNNIKRKIKAIQISLEEAVLVCEEKECIWPIGYRNLVFLQRKANSDNLDELPKETHDQIPISMELSLYTPPVTPIGHLVENLVNLPSEEKLDGTSKIESTKSKKDPTESNMSPHEVRSNGSIKENETIVHEKNANKNACRTVFKISNIQKNNPDIATMLENTNENTNYKKIQKDEHSLINTTSVMNTTENYNALFDILYKELSLNTESKTENEHTTSNNAQSDAMNCLETNSNLKMLESTKMDNVDTDTSSLSLSDSIFNISGSDLNLDILLNDLSKESVSNEEISDVLDLLK